MIAGEASEYQPNAEENAGKTPRGRFPQALVGVKKILGSKFVPVSTIVLVFIRPTSLGAGIMLKTVLIATM